MPTAKQIESRRRKEAKVREWKEKADKWDKLEIDIGKYYKLEDGTVEVEGDLCAIGEIAARAFGYL